jgi:hypothetical protein
MTKLLDFILAILVGIGGVFLAKIILVSIGSQYGFEFFANLSWKDYWGASAIGTMYLLATIIRVNTKKDKEDNDLQLTINAITHLLMMLFVWGLASGINYLFFS